MFEKKLKRKQIQNKHARCPDLSESSSINLFGNLVYSKFKKLRSNDNSRKLKARRGLLIQNIKITCHNLYTILNGKRAENPRLFILKPIRAAAVIGKLKENKP